VTPTTPAEADLERRRQELAALLGRAEKGDRSALPALREALDANPAVWQRYGDLGEQALASLALLAAGPNLLLAESLGRKLAALKEELGGGSPSPLVRLLAARVTATWLQTAYYDGLLAQSAGAGEARLKLLQRQQDAAHRRHLAAVKTLATVTRLLRPPLSPVDVAARMGGAGGGRRHHAGPEPAGAAAGN